MVTMHGAADRCAHRTTARPSRAESRAGRATEDASQSEQRGLDSRFQNASHPEILPIASALFSRDQGAPLTPPHHEIPSAENLPFFMLRVLQSESPGE